MLIAVTFRDFIHKYGFFFLILLFMRFHVYAQHSEIKQPLIVKYGIFVKKLSVDYKNSTFHSEFFWWAIYENDSLKTGMLNDDILNFEYVNGVNEETGSVKNEIQYVRKEGNNYWVSGFHQGDFYFNPDAKLRIIAFAQSWPVHDFRRLRWLNRFVGPFISRLAGFWVFSTSGIRRSSR